MKVKDPIPFDKLLQYYTHDHALARPKSQIQDEIDDLITITNFLSAKIPYEIKSIKTKMNEAVKNLKKIRTQLDKVLNEVDDPSRENRLSMNPLFAYDMFCRLSHDGDDLDFTEYFAEKQMKLKFLSCKNLPKNLTWKSIYSPNTSQLIIPSRKHQISVGLTIRAGQTQYRWELRKVEQINLKKKLNYLVMYFQEVIRPILQKKYPDGYEDYALSHMIKLLEFVELIEIHRYLNQITNNIGNRQREISIQYSNKEFIIGFTSLETDEKPILTVNVEGRADFCFEVMFEMKKVTARIKADTHEFICDSFCIPNFCKFIEAFPVLLELLDRLKKFEGNFQYFHNQVKNLILIKWNNFLWTGKIGENNSCEMTFVCQRDGVYIIKNHRNKCIQMSISKQGKVLSERINEQFIRRLIMKIPKNSVQYQLIFFNFMYTIEYFIEDNQNPDNFHLHDYNVVKASRGNQAHGSPMTVSIEEEQIDEYKLDLKFKKRNLIEQWMYKNYIRERQHIDQYTFSVLTLRIEFEMDLKSMILTTINKESISPIPEVFKLPEYIDMIQDKKPGDPIDIEIGIKQINSLRSNVILRKIIDNRYPTELRNRTVINI